jgi:hypothetical protein
MWAKQNHLISTRDLQEVAAQVQESGEDQAIDAQAKQIAGSLFQRLKNARSTKPLEFPLLPSFVTGPASHFTAGLAGLLLVISAFCGSRFRIVVLIAAAGGLLSLHWLGMAW